MAEVEVKKVVVPEGSLAVPGPAVNQAEAAFSVLYHCVTEVADITMTHVMRVLYSHRLRKAQEGIHTLRQQLQKVKWDEEKIQLKFGRFKELLEVDLRTAEKLDAGFCLNVIQAVCNIAFDLLSAETRANVLLVHKYKFKICHSYATTLDALHQELARFKNIVNTIYQEVEHEFNCKDNNMAMVGAVLEHTEQGLRAGGQAGVREKFRSDTEVQMLISAQQELTQRYQALEVCGPFHFLVKKGQARKGLGAGTGAGVEAEQMLPPLSTGAAGHGPLEEVREVFSTALAREEAGVGVDVVLVSGAPGSGKTSLCYHLLQQWCERLGRISGLDHIDLVLLVERARVSGKQPSLDRVLLGDFLRNTKGKFPDQLSSVSSLLRYDLLVVVDGFLPHEQDEMVPLLREVFRRFSGSLVVMTTLPAALAHTEAVFVSGNNLTSLTLNVCQLNKRAKLALAEHACRLANPDTDRGCSLYSTFTNHHCQGLDQALVNCQEPTTALLYAALWKPGNPPLSTPSSLHRFLLNSLLEEFLIRSGLARSEVTQEKARLSHQLGHLAWEQLQKGSHGVPLQSAVQLGMEVLLPVLFTSIMDRSAQPTCTFASLPQQLHLAATFLASALLQDPAFLAQLKEAAEVWRKFPELLHFLVGELGSMPTRPAIMEAALKSAISLTHLTGVTADALDHWCQLALEGGHSATVANFIKDLLPRDCWKLGPTTVVPGLKLLSHIPVTVRCFVVDIPNDIDPYHIPELLEVLENLHATCKSRFSLELHLWMHNECGGSQPSNSLLHTLYPWATLTNFTGEIGAESSGKMLMNPNHLRTLRVRIACPTALHTLHNITRHMNNTCQRVRVTLDLPDCCELASLEPLDCTQLELIFPKVHEKNWQWVVDVVKRVTGRLRVWRLSLNICSLSEKNLSCFLGGLRGLVTDKLSLQTTEDLDRKTQRRLRQLATFTIEWL